MLGLMMRMCTILVVLTGVISFEVFAYFWMASSPFGVAADFTLTYCDTALHICRSQSGDVYRPPDCFSLHQTFLDFSEKYNLHIVLTCC